MPIIFKLSIFWHSVIWRPLIIVGVLILSALQVVSRANFQNIIAVDVGIMTNIQKFFFHMCSPLWAPLFGCPLLYKGQLISSITDSKGNLSFLVRDIDFLAIVFACLLQKLCEVRYDACLGRIFLALAL